LARGEFILQVFERSNVHTIRRTECAYGVGEHHHCDHNHPICQNQGCGDETGAGARVQAGADTKQFWMAGAEAGGKNFQQWNRSGSFKYGFLFHKLGLWRKRV